jgi:hypothetical protein
VGAFYAQNDSRRDGGGRQSVIGQVAREFRLARQADKMQLSFWENRGKSGYTDSPRTANVLGRVLCRSGRV